MQNKKKIVVIVPIKKNSKRVKNKNFKNINGLPLYKITLKKLKKCKFDEIYVDSDSKEIENFCNLEGIKFIKRKPFLATDKANGNDLLNYHRKLIDADYYFQILITSPLLRIKTINNCISYLKKSKKYDSIFTTQKFKTFFWFKDRPVNYLPKELPRSQDLKPLIIETTSLYGIKKKSLDKYKCRIGKKPYFYEVDDFEAVDLNNKKDFEYLEYLIKNNFSKNKNITKKQKEYLNF
jgi:CMP-N-acetylneuraminic acid synthetase